MKKELLIVLLGLSSLTATSVFAAGVELYCESGDPSGKGSTLDIELDVVSGDHVLGTRTRASFYNSRTNRRSTRNYFNSRILRGERSDVINFVLDKNYTIEIRLPNNDVDFHTVTITPSEAAMARGFEIEELSCNE